MGDFDEDAAIEASQVSDCTYAPEFVDGARWQHQQSHALIAKLKAERNGAEDAAVGSALLLASANAELTKLREENATLSKAIEADVFIENQCCGRCSQCDHQCLREEPG